MKKLILLLALAIVMCECNEKEPQISKDNIVNINGWNCKVIEIDSCEYIQGGYLLSHKGNCKYCAERRRKEQEEEIQEKAKSLYYHFCVRETCEGEDNCTNCPYGKVIEPLVSMAKWADQHPRKGLWDSEKVIKWLRNNQQGFILTDMDIDDLRKAMED